MSRAFTNDVETAARTQRARRWLVLSEAEVLRLDLSTVSLRQEAADLVAAEAVDLDAPTLLAVCRVAGGSPSILDAKSELGRMLGGLVVRRVMAMRDWPARG